MKYEATELDYQKAELAAHKIAPLFQLYGWTWSFEEGEYVPSVCGIGYRKKIQRVPTVQEIADEFVRLIEEVMNGDGNDIILETGRLGIRKGPEGVELYLTL